MKDKKPVEVIETSIMGAEPLLWGFAVIIVIIGGAIAAFFGFFAFIEWLK